MSQSLRVYFGGREIPRDKIMKWEVKRARSVLRKLGARAQSDDVHELREQLLKLKTEIGYDGLIARLQRDLSAGEVFARVTAGLSFGARRFSCIEIHSDSGTAEQFVEWFEQRGHINDERSMLLGTPDHYVIRTTETGLQEVVETTGGSPMPARFMIDFEDLSSLKSKKDPEFPLQLAGVARAANGKAIGGVRHQFRNTDKGFEAKLTVEFPLTITPGIIGGHRWHLANEFSNWIEMSLAA